MKKKNKKIRKKRLYIVKSEYGKNKWKVVSRNGSVFEHGSKAQILKFIEKHKNEYNFQVGINHI